MSSKKVGGHSFLEQGSPVDLKAWVRKQFKNVVLLCVEEGGYILKTRRKKPDRESCGMIQKVPTVDWDDARTRK